MERLPAARDRAVPPSGWRGELTLVTRHGLGAPGFVEVPRARRHEITRGRLGTSRDELASRVASCVLDRAPSRDPCR